jgi:hypothetical protein
MALNYVVLTCDVYDAQGNPPTSGTATFTPSATLTDTTNHEIVAQIPITVSFKAGQTPTVKLLATDDGTLAPSGWGWTVTFTGTGMPSAFSFFLPHASGASQNLSSQIPVGTVPTAYLPLRVFYVDTYGADPTGAADSTAAFAAAVAAMPTVTVNNGTTSATYPVGTLVLSAGAYKLGSSGDVGNLGPFVNVTGPGRNACILYYYGAGGDCLRAYNAVKPANFGFVNMFTQAAPYGNGGIYDGFIIDGTYATGISAGLHIGDFEGGALGPDLLIQNFSTGQLSAPVGLAASAAGSGGTFAANTYYWVITGTTRTGETLISSEVNATLVLDGSASLTWTALTGATGYNIYRGTSAGGENVLVAQVGTVTSYTDTGTSAGTGAPAAANSSGSVGLFLDNQYAWTENFWGRVVLFNNATGVTMIGCDSTTSGKSFEYNDFTFKIYQETGQNGVVLQGGANYNNGSLKIRGNCLLAGSSQGAAFLAITGQVRSDNSEVGNWSHIQNSHLELQTEANSSGAYSPATILFGSPGSSRNNIINGTGVISFESFATSTNLTAANAGAFTFSGPVNGDTLLAQIALSQGYGYAFGNGLDGAVTLDGSTTYNGWSSLNGSTYTLNRDPQATTLVINSGVTVKTNGFRMFATLSITNGGTIDDSGGAASGATGGTGDSAASVILGAVAGATGTSGNGAQGSAGGTAWGSGTAGAGGAGSGKTGGGSRSGAAPGDAFHRLPSAVLAGAGGWNGATHQPGATGGAGSGGGDATNSGGGGGASGGLIALLAPVITNTGTISANGGAGGTPPTGNCGGGGGGAGGIILAYTRLAWTAGTVSVTGGAPGSGVGTGGNGSAGTSGSVLNVVLS